jgi:anti-sigma regulatory factor (Ser/Thr protein kinase)
MSGSASATTFVLKNRLTELETLRACLEQFAETYELPPRAAFETNLALDELVTNIISYGFADDR